MHTIIVPIKKLGGDVSGFYMNEKPRINCIQCKHYAVTWDTHFPKGCRLFKFKSRAAPSQTVYEATGTPCEHYCRKAVAGK
jgi:hypothetical protein